MSEHRPEVADVFRTYGDDFLALWERVLSRVQRKAFDDIRICRTAALGGHMDQCDQCGHCAISYNSRNDPRDRWCSGGPAEESQGKPRRIPARNRGTAADHIITVKTQGLR